jgi:hypothetical protein
MDKGYGRSISAFVLFSAAASSMWGSCLQDQGISYQNIIEITHLRSTLSFTILVRHRPCCLVYLGTHLRRRESLAPLHGIEVPERIFRLPQSAV